MDFTIFLLVNGALFLRPADLIPELYGVPLLQCLVLANLAAAGGAVIKQCQPKALWGRPITVCVLGVWAAVVLSHVVRMDAWHAQSAGAEFGKSAILYLLTIAILRTPVRFDRFAATVALLAAALAGVSLLEYHGYLELSSLRTLEEVRYDDSTGERDVVPRLQSVGIFSDPNDLCLLLILAILIGAYFIQRTRSTAARVLWATVVLECVYALILTKSRGGMLALGSAMGVWTLTRYGWPTAAMLAVTGGAGLMAIPKFRQLNVGEALSADTGQSRVQLWSDGLNLLKENPLLGIGEGRYVEEAGQVAHNSFLHAFSELGLLGGMAFFGAFFISIAGLYRLRLWSLDPWAKSWRPFLLAAIVGYCVGMMSISRCYVATTYVVLGMAASFLLLATGSYANAPFVFDFRLVRRVSFAGLQFLTAIFVFVQTFVRWQ